MSTNLSSLTPPDTFQASLRYVAAYQKVRILDAQYRYNKACSPTFLELVGKAVHAIFGIKLPDYRQRAYKAERAELVARVDALSARLNELSMRDARRSLIKPTQVGNSKGLQQLQPNWLNS